VSDVPILYPPVHPERSLAALGTDSGVISEIRRTVFDPDV
jgi:hypothetical protein